MIYVFEMGGVRVCHMGDFGQAELRPEQRKAIGKIDLLFIPVGGLATIDGRAAAELVELLAPSWVVPMHYRTPAISFLEPLDAFLAAVKGEVVALDRSAFDTDRSRTRRWADDRRSGASKLASRIADGKDCRRTGE